MSLDVCETCRLDLFLDMNGCGRHSETTTWGDVEMSREHLRALQDTVEQSAEATSKKISEMHTKKFNQLKGKKKPNSTKVDNEKWVVNCSQRTLDPIEITALEKGLNFSITPKKIPVAKILSSVENGIFSLL